MRYCKLIQNCFALFWCQILGLQSVEWPSLYNPFERRPPSSLKAHLHLMCSITSIWYTNSALWHYIINNSIRSQALTKQAITYDCMSSYEYQLVRIVTYQLACNLINVSASTSVPPLGSICKPQSIELKTDREKEALWRRCAERNTTEKIDA